MGAESPVASKVTYKSTLRLAIVVTTALLFIVAMFLAVRFLLRANAPDGMPMVVRSLQSTASLGYSGITMSETADLDGNPVRRSAKRTAWAGEEKVEHLDGRFAGAVFGKSRELIWLYDPAAKRYMQYRRNDLPADRTVSLVRQNYDARVVGSETVAGRQCEVIELRSKRNSAPSRKLWLDKRTGIMLREETYALSGARRGEMFFRLIDTNPPKPKSGWCDPPSNLPADVRRVDESRDASSSSVSSPAFVPAGYALVSTRTGKCPSGCALNAGRQVYTDGLNNLTVFSIPPECIHYRREAELEGNLVRKRGPDGSVAVRSTREGFFAAAGEIEASVLVQIVTSMGRQRP